MRRKMWSFTKSCLTVLRNIGYCCHCTCLYYCPLYSIFVCVYVDIWRMSFDMCVVCTEHTDGTQCPVVPRCGFRCIMCSPVLDMYIEYLYKYCTGISFIEWRYTCFGYMCIDGHFGLCRKKKCWKECKTTTSWWCLLWTSREGWWFCE